MCIMETKLILRGSIYMADLPLVKGSSVQGGIRPVLVVQNNRRKYICSDSTGDSAYLTL